MSSSTDSVYNLIQDLDIKYPDKAPLYELSQFELGKLAGQRILIEVLKQQYKFGEINTIEKEK